jgi:hypothetical protein
MALDRAIARLSGPLALWVPTLLVEREATSAAADSRSRTMDDLLYLGIGIALFLAAAFFVRGADDAPGDRT